MSTAILLRIVLKVARVVVHVWLRENRDGRGARRAIILGLVREGLQHGERRAMRDLFQDERFMAGVGMILDGVIEMRESAISRKR